ncbi:TSUP family transporter [Alphaproteobacteria bacterium GH1-50]|uniref:Probable membrane transporter protein n=1 Tax=Kangsaoukella pontilimi TaxID=2691042 RepID=A0A7C9MD82_9RHOB|nr:sulfite exporter TauE/SafE family protein [Kangsaoukella pontilimi]MXQ08071.1 TSUP family transporter [Kangsaoukella pontilimi]
MNVATVFDLGPLAFVFAASVAVVAGFVKGATGFAMPMVMISGLGSFLAPEVALAALILPTLVSNLWQAFRQGVAAAWASAREHWRYVTMVALFIALAAQLVTSIPSRALFLILGVPVTIFAILQLSGWRPTVHDGNRRRVEYGVGAFAGTLGGLSGVWGPPTVLYLMAMNTPKRESVRVQGVVYGTGSVMLLGGHMTSGVLNPATLPLSMALVVPAVLGLLIGFVVQDRLDQDRFRTLTLIVLVIAGLNLIRRGLGF